MVDDLCRAESIGRKETSASSELDRVRHRVGAPFLWHRCEELRSRTVLNAEMIDGNDTFVEGNGNLTHGVHGNTSKEEPALDHHKPRVVTHRGAGLTGLALFYLFDPNFAADRDGHEVQIDLPERIASLRTLDKGGTGEENRTA